MRGRFHCLGLLVALAACSQGDAQSTPPPRQAATCNASAVAQFVGQKVTPALGKRLIALSHAKILRWGPPRTALTMDFRPERLTVAYDDDMVITSARCQ